jgi:hypothetical protein
MEHRKADLRGKFIAKNAYIKNTEWSQINNLLLHLKHLEKQEQAKFKTSRKREKIKIQVQINEMDTKKNANNQWNKIGSLKK